jgi:exopolysaccharide production protein ExoZ
MIGNIQMLRGIAALAVAFYHTAILLPGGAHTDFLGVPTFFVISGFIMCHIAHKEPAQFLLRRVIRIVPLYWLCTIGIFLLSVRVGAFRSSTWTVNDFGLYLAGSLFFSPSEKFFPYIGAGWTLNLEMYFYMLFALALLISRRAAPLLAGGAVLAGLMLPYLGCGHYACAFYGHFYVWFFPIGIGLFYAWSFVKDRLPVKPTMVGGGVALFSCYFLQPFLGDAPIASPLLYVLPAIIVAAALCLASVGADVRAWPILLLGDASYALYLMHSTLIGMWSPVGSAWSAIVILAVCSLIAIGTHLLIERPIDRFLRARLLCRRSHAAADVSVARLATP